MKKYPPNYPFGGRKSWKGRTASARTFLNRTELPKSRPDSPSRTDTEYPPLSYLV